MSKRNEAKNFSAHCWNASFPGPGDAPHGLWCHPDGGREKIWQAAVG